MDSHTVKPLSVETGMELTTGISVLVLICFFLSGLTGLVYEILWTRMIVKVVGSAPFAVSIILTTFMGGLGLGSFIASRTIDQLDQPSKLLRLYALLELAIGGYGVIFPGLLIVFKPLYQLVYNHLFQNLLLYNGVTLIGCAFLLLFPVTCMGATLPVLCRFYVAQLRHLGTRTGRLYALNTLGAAVGSLWCGFWSINLLGVWGTLMVTVVLNGLIGGVCLLVSFWVPTWSISPNASTPRATRSSRRQPTSAGGTIAFFSQDETVGALAIFAVSGFCAMAYEVIWTRLLGLIIGPTTYSFTIILATFIVGLALGSLMFGWWGDRIRQPLWLLIATQLGAALLALGVSQLLGNSQFFFAKLIYHFKDQFGWLSFIKAMILFWVMIGPTLCLGATFPLVGKVCTPSLARIGRSIGVAYAINTVGAVLGSFASDFVLIPWCGKEKSLSVVIGIQLITSLVVGGIVLRRKRSSAVRWISLSGATLAALFLCISFPHWNRQLLAMGRYHRFESFSSELRNSSWLDALWRGPRLVAKYNTNSELMYYGDGMGGFTTVLRGINVLGIAEYSLLNSGKVDASSRGDMSTQTLLAHVPLLLHPNPREVMILGLASGITAGEVLHYPVEKIDVVEISAQVVSASNFFIPWNNNVVSNPKTEIIIQDGRVHLELTHRKYDVIISEPSNPWMAGLASLFTREFFLLAREKLREGGIFVQFFHSYQMDWPTFAMIGRTFAQVFPNSMLINTFPSLDRPRIESDYLLIGCKGGDRLRIGNALKRIAFAQHSKNIALPDARILSRLVVSEDLHRLFGLGPIHSDNWPRLEFAAPQQMYRSDPTIDKTIQSNKWLNPETEVMLREVASVEGQIAFATFALSLYQPFAHMVDLEKATPEQRERFYKLMEQYCTRAQIDDYSIFTDQELTQRCLATYIATMQNNLDRVPDKGTVYTYLAEAYDVKGEYDRAMEYYQQALASNYHSAGLHLNLGMAYGKRGEWDQAINEYQKALEIDHYYAEAHSNLGNVYIKKGEIDKAIQELTKALALNPNLAEAHNNLGNVYYNKGEFDQAISEYTKTFTINPRQAEAYQNCGNAYRKIGELDKAISMFKKALAVKPDYAKAHYNLGMSYYYNKDYKLALLHCNRAVELGESVNPKLLELIKSHR